MRAELALNFKPDSKKLVCQSAAPDGDVIEVFEPGALREAVVRDYYGFGG